MINTTRLLIFGALLAVAMPAFAESSETTQPLQYGLQLLENEVAHLPALHQPTREDGALFFSRTIGENRAEGSLAKKIELLGQTSLDAETVHLTGTLKTNNGGEVEEIPLAFDVELGSSYSYIFQVGEKNYRLIFKPYLKNN